MQHGDQLSNLHLQRPSRERSSRHWRGVGREMSAAIVQVACTRVAENPRSRWAPFRTQSTASVWQRGSHTPSPSTAATGRTWPDGASSLCGDRQPCLSHKRSLYLMLVSLAVESTGPTTELGLGATSMGCDGSHGERRAMATRGGRGEGTPLSTAHPPTPITRDALVRGETGPPTLTQTCVMAEASLRRGCP